MLYYIPMAERLRATLHKGKIVILTPAEAKEAKAQLGQEALSDTGRQVLKIVANGVVHSGGEKFSLDVDREFNHPGYGLKKDDIDIIVAELGRSKWKLTIEGVVVPGETWGSGNWWNIKGTPITNGAETTSPNQPNPTSI